MNVLSKYAISIVELDENYEAEMHPQIVFSKLSDAVAVLRSLRRVNRFESRYVNSTPLVPYKKGDKAQYVISESFSDGSSPKVKRPMNSDEKSVWLSQRKGYAKYKEAKDLITLLNISVIRGRLTITRICCVE